MAIHIRQKNSNATGTNAYTVVNTHGYVGALENHPCMIDHPELFEIVDAVIPDDAQYLNYSE